MPGLEGERPVGEYGFVRLVAREVLQYMGDGVSSPSKWLAVATGECCEHSPPTCKAKGPLALSVALSPLCVN